MQQRLSDMGKWLKVNGEAIYSTRPWEVASKSADIAACYTTKGKDLYVIFTKYPTQPVTIQGITRKPAAVKLLGSAAKVSCSHSGKNLTLRPPALSIGQAPCDYAWVFRIADCL
jgi:alpha-L-fucosidase